MAQYQYIYIHDNTFGALGPVNTADQPVIAAEIIAGLQGVQKPMHQVVTDGVLMDFDVFLTV